MKQPFLPFALPDIGDEEIAEVVDSLKSGWVTTGPKAKRFETDFSGFLGGGIEAISVNSATAGLHLALEAVGIGPGDEVIVPTYTFTATAEVVRYLGADPKFVDIDPRTLCIDPAGIERAISDRTKAIMPVHFAGLACDMDAIIGIAKRNGLKVVEDAAHALPTRYKGSLVGTFDTDATVFSFYATKTITTGEGGMVVSKNPQLAERCRIMRLHGISRDAFDRYTSTKPAWQYEVVAPGYKYNLTDLAAALGIQQLKKAWRFQKRRMEMGARYDRELADLPVTLPAHAPEGDIHAWHLYVIRLRNDARVGRNQFIQELAERGIGTSVHFIPLHLQPYWRDTYRLEADDFPVASAVFDSAVSLPLYTKMTDEQQTRVIESVREILG